MACIENKAQMNLVSHYFDFRSNQKINPSAYGEKLAYDYSNYHLFIMYQQQHFSKLQLTHSLSDLLRTHSSGRQLQSAHFIFLSV
jgi:hypothetical protein